MIRRIVERLDAASVIATEDLENYLVLPDPGTQDLLESFDPWEDYHE